MSARFRIGIDLGGTKIEGAAVDIRGSVRVRRRVATPTEDYHATIAAIIALIGCIDQETGTTASVGVGIPGAVSPATGLIKNANSTWLNGRPLQRDLAHLLEDLAIDFPLLASIVEQRAGGQRRLPLGARGNNGEARSFVAASVSASR